MATNTVDTMTEVLALEAKSALSYVNEMTWPSVIDKPDEQCMKLFQDCWAKEEPFLDRLVDMASDSGGIPTLFGTYRFAPSRLNFSTPSHLMGVVPALIRDEIEVIEEIAGEATPDSPFAALLQELLAVKRDGVEAMEKLHAKLDADRKKAVEAASQAGAAEAADAAGDGDDALAFRDPDMEIDDRMSKVEDQNLETKLWAAMAQTDCTACGYDCEGYAKAIASGEDKDLSKCVPGEDVTENMLKKLMGA